MTIPTARACCVTLAAAGVPDWIELLPAGPDIAGVDGRAWTLPDPQTVVTAFRQRAKQADKDSLRIGTPLVYGATHQFGDPRRSIPARPFLGLSTDDKTELVAILNDWLTRAIR